MTQKPILLSGKQANGYVVPLGPVNLVLALTNAGMIACGAFDIMALDKFDYPAAKIRGADGKPITSIENLLAGVVREVNTAAARRGITVDMTGKTALELL